MSFKIWSSNAFLTMNKDELNLHSPSRQSSVIKTVTINQNPKLIKCEFLNVYLKLM